MALIKCKECRNEVSKKATNCPSCGAPVKRKNIGCFGGMFLIVLLVIFISVVREQPHPSGGYNKISTPPRHAPTQEKKHEVDSIIVRGQKIQTTALADDVFSILHEQDQVSQNTLPDKKLGGFFIIKNYNVDGKAFEITFARTENPGPYRVILIKE